MLSRRYLTYNDLVECGMLKYSRKHLAVLMRKGLFPAAIQITENRIAWPEHVIDEWLQSRPVAYCVDARPRPYKRGRPGRPVGSRWVVEADGTRRLVTPEKAAPARKRERL